MTADDRDSLINFAFSAFLTVIVFVVVAALCWKPV